jgi:hypothetical protein
MTDLARPAIDESFRCYHLYLMSERSQQKEGSSRYLIEV